MDMHQKQEIRKRKRLEKCNDEPESKGQNIHWFPGHMMKAKRNMIESIKTVDMVIEIRDCRIPYSSKNPMIEQIIQNKPRLILLSKKDKGELVEINKWIKHLENETTKVIAIDLLNDNVISILTNACQQIMKPKIDKMISRGINPRAVRAMVCGIPNVGKSTMINAIAKKRIAKTADKPGVTRALQWVKLNKNLELLDTPGVLWPKFEDQQVGLYLALTGAIRDEVIPIEDIVIFALKRLITEYPDNLIQRYNIEISEDPYETLKRIGLSRKFMRLGDEVDYKRTMEIFLNELRDDKVGRVTWEKVE